MTVTPLIYWNLELIVIKFKKPGRYLTICKQNSYLYVVVTNFHPSRINYVCCVDLYRI